MVCLRSSVQPTHDAMFSRLFRDVHYPRHWTAAAHGCLKPAPASRLRRVLLHLWYSTALHERVLDTTSRKSSNCLNVPCFWRNPQVHFEDETKRKVEVGPTHPEALNECLTGEASARNFKSSLVAIDRHSSTSALGPVEPFEVAGP